MMTALCAYGGLKFHIACETLIREFGQIYPDWAKLAKIACTIPMSSVPAERGFSLQNRIKTAMRSRLLRIASSTKDLQTFNFAKAAGHFTATKSQHACATCAKFRLKVRDPSSTEEEKRVESASFILHRIRARVFYDLLGKVDNEAVTVCFDMMQNLVLPKTPISQAYYSQQLYMYVFGVVVHHGKDTRKDMDKL
ncbi:hypothetical protein CRUP_034448 [Coryphaenoides rupestris]|nr:hypothetical protein CRUP_034448 [Coryphaenoides rupestris]